MRCTYAQVKIIHEYEAPELDMADYIQQHGEPADYRTVRLYIVYQDPDMEKLVIWRNGYFAGKFYFSQVRRLHRQPARSTGNGRYHIGDQTIIIPPNDPPAFTTTEEVPRPKTRLECRWHDGRWEKYLKTKGWVTA